MSMRSHLLIPFLPIYSICRWSHIQTLGWKREELPTASTISHHNTTTTPLSLKPSSSRFKKRYVNEAFIATTTNQRHGHGQWWTPAPHIISKDSTDRVYTFDTLTNRAKIFLHYMLSSSLAAHPLALPSTTGAADLLLQLSRERGTIEMNNCSGGRSRVDQGSNSSDAGPSSATTAGAASVVTPVIEREEDVLSDSDDEGGPAIAFQAPPRAPSVISPQHLTLTAAASQANIPLPANFTNAAPLYSIPNTHNAILGNAIAPNTNHTQKPTRPPPTLDKPAPKKRKVVTTPATLTPSDLDGLSFASNFYSTSIPLLDTGIYTIPPPPDGGRNELPANYLRLKSTSNGSILYPIQSSARNAPTPAPASSNGSTIGVRAPTSSRSSVTLPFSPFSTATSTAKVTETAAHPSLPNSNPTPASSTTTIALPRTTTTVNTLNQQSNSASATSSDLPYYTAPQDSHFTPTLTLAISGDDSNSSNNSTTITTNNISNNNNNNNNNNNHANNEIVTALDIGHNSDPSFIIETPMIASTAPPPSPTTIEKDSHNSDPYTTPTNDVIQGVQYTPPLTPTPASQPTAPVTETNTEYIHLPTPTTIPATIPAITNINTSISTNGHNSDPSNPAASFIASLKSRQCSSGISTTTTTAVVVKGVATVKVAAATEGHHNSDLSIGGGGGEVGIVESEIISKKGHNSECKDESVPISSTVDTLRSCGITCDNSDLLLPAPTNNNNKNSYNHTTYNNNSMHRNMTENT